MCPNSFINHDSIAFVNSLTRHSTEYQFSTRYTQTHTIIPGYSDKIHVNISKSDSQGYKYADKL